MVTSTSLLLSWDPLAYEDQNGVIIGYVINVTVQETGASFQLESTTTELAVSNLKPYRTYVCVIAAATSVGTGPFSEIYIVKTPEDGKTQNLCQLHVYLFIFFSVPGEPPLNFSVSVTSSSSAYLTWHPPSYEKQNGEIVQYVIRASVLETGENFELTESEQSLELNTLKPYRSYEFSIAAATSVGLGPYSSIVSVETPEDGEYIHKPNLILTFFTSQFHVNLLST